jgi:hypothetical protein
MTAKKMLLEIPSIDLRFPVTMHWEDAPETCRTVWHMLEQPLTTKTNHAVFSGYEFYLYCPAVNLELENHVVYPKPGQFLYYYLEPGRNAGNIAHKVNLEGKTGDAAEIAIWYGEGELRRMTELGVRGNLFASIDERHQELFTKGYRLLNGGQEIATLSRLEG